jgi:beta-glucosidase-like glycosyl hydrolase/CubicO group peptidase (beta-lactamase class C family)
MKKHSFLLALLFLLLGIAIVQVAHATHRKKKPKKTTVIKKHRSTKKGKIVFDPNTYETLFPVSGDTLKWVEEQLARLNDTERIGQFFMLPVWNNKDSVNSLKVQAYVKQYAIGGIILMQGSAYRHATYINRIQANAKIPLLCSMDAEWGLAMRVDSITAYPHELTLGAIQNDSLIEEMGYRIGRQCLRLGIQVNFAPVVDINSNPLNPVINDRSFGENPDKVITKGKAYMLGLQRAGAMACAKHFPGHGATSVDSHADLPVLDFTRQRLDSLELRPFKALIDAGVQSVMVAHLAIPSIEKDTKIPASLSPKMVTQLLKQELGFTGLTYTDALNMKGVTKNFSGGNADLKALLAGNDILLFGEDVPAAIQLILQAIKKGLISQQEIDNRVRKILYYKYKLGLNKPTPIPLANLQSDLNKDEAFIKSLYQEAITIVPGKTKMIRVKPSVIKRKAAVTIGGDSSSAFQKYGSAFETGNRFYISSQATEAEFKQLLDTLNYYREATVDIHNMSRFISRDYGLSANCRFFISTLDTSDIKVNWVIFGSPYSLKFFNSDNTCLIAYEDNSATAKVAAEALYARNKVTGRLPITASAAFAFNGGASIEKAIPKIAENALPNYFSPNIRPNQLNQIDSIVKASIEAKAFPGCQLVVMQKGQLFYRKSFGDFTYDNVHEVQNIDLYDLASITKIAATTLCCMKLYETGKLDLNKTIGDYLPEAKKTNKRKIKVKNLLLHQAGLVPYIPFYKGCLDNNNNWKATIQVKKDAQHTLPITDQLYINAAYLDTMWQEIYKSEIKTPGKYVYSDLDMYFLKRICDQILANDSFSSFLNTNFYQPLQLKSMCFNPLNNGFTKHEIAPTENDLSFRKQLVCGSVHDPGAAMSGGVQGHAGLFSNATDLATLMSMLCQEGVYNRKYFFEAKTVNLFTKKQSKVSRRGLGFDKQSPEQIKDSPTCASASPATFGHTGFTGTSVWADPENGLVFVFLSNRVYPIAENKKIIQLNTRTNLQELFYTILKN